MPGWFWLSCSIVLLLLAILDYALLWRMRRGGDPDGGWFSPFTLAAQGAFATFAALYAASLALEDFPAAGAIVAGELAFLVLMAIGAAADWSRSRGRG